MATLAPSLRFGLAPDWPVDTRPPEPTRAVAFATWIGAGVALVFTGAFTARLTIAAQARPLNTFDPTPEFVLGRIALALALGFGAAYAGHVLTGARPVRFARALLPLLVLGAWFFAPLDVPPAGHALRLLGAWPELLLAWLGGVVAALYVGIFLHEATMRGARLAMPRWRAPKLGRLLVAIAVVQFFAYLVAQHPAEPSLRTLANFYTTFLRFALLLVPAGVGYLLAQRLTGSAGFAFAAGAAWLLLLAQHDLLERILWNDAAAVGLFLLALLGYQVRGGFVFGFALTATLVLAPDWSLAVACVGLFLWLGQRDPVWGLVTTTVGLYVYLSWSVYLFFTSAGAILPLPLRVLADAIDFGGAHALPDFAGPFGSAMLAFLLSGFVLCLWRPATLLFVTPAVVLATLALAVESSAAAPATLLWLFAFLYYAMLQGAQRFAYDRPIRRGDTRRAFQYVEATPDNPPPPVRDTDFVTLPRGPRLSIVPRPWTPMQAILLRAATVALVAPPLLAWLV